MPLTTCSACGRQVSIEADRCPACGHPIGRGFLGRAGTERTLNIGCLALVIVIVGYVFLTCHG